MVSRHTSQHPHKFPTSHFQPSQFPDSPPPQILQPSRPLGPSTPAPQHPQYSITPLPHYPSSPESCPVKSLLLKPKIEIKDLSCRLFTPVADRLTATVTYGTSTRYPQIAIHRSMDRHVPLRFFESYSAAERIPFRREYRAQADQDFVRKIRRTRFDGTCLSRDLPRRRDGWPPECLLSRIRGEPFHSRCDASHS